MIGRIIGWLRQGLELFLIGGVRFYQICLGPLLPKVCRYYPSCSQYFILAVQARTDLRSLQRRRRIARCHPWSAGGFDPP